MSQAKEDLEALAYYINEEFERSDVTRHNAVDRVIELMDEMLSAESAETTIKVAENAMADHTIEPDYITLVASNLTKQGQQPWSQWDEPMDEVVETLVQRAKGNQSRPGFQFEVIDAQVVQRVTIETILNVRGS
jgi:hypothetical protein